MIIPNKSNNNPLGSFNTKSIIKFPCLPQKCLFILWLVCLDSGSREPCMQGFVFLILKKKRFYLFIYFWLCWVFIMLGLSPGCGEWSSHHNGFSCCVVWAVACGL